ncbi:MAG TPA: hypothetical protein VNT33_09890 [Telluria sp.]|nr:hypothetical protein [Telluria sp.]
MMLQRLTTQYVDLEDRVRLSGQDGDGRVQVLWLSQRLLNRLVPALCRMLERAAQGEHAALLQGFEQEAARARQQPQEPVNPEAPVGDWLVAAVDVNKSADGFLLRFRGASEDQVASILLAEMPLRQWLAIVLDQYRRAEWPVGVWPDWMDPAAAPAPGGVMH